MSLQSAEPSPPLHGLSARCWRCSLSRLLPSQPIPVAEINAFWPNAKRWVAKSAQCPLLFPAKAFRLFFLRSLALSAGRPPAALQRQVLRFGNPQIEQLPSQHSASNYLFQGNLMKNKVFKITAAVGLLTVSAAAFAASDCCGDFAACCLQALACCF